MLTYVENDVRISVEEFAVILFGPVGHLEFLDDTVQHNTLETYFYLTTQS